MFELHVEKMVLGGTLVIAGLLGARQFLTNPNAVNFNGTTYSPSEVDEAIKAKTDALGRQLASTRRIDYSAGESLAGYFLGEKERTLGSETTLAHAIVRPTPLALGDESAMGGAVGLYHAFAPAAPDNFYPMARPYTVGEEAVTDHPGLAKFLPASAPYDVPVVHLFAEVNGVKLLENLLYSEEERSAIPTGWYADMSILDVVVERERQLADGNWGELQVVQTIPGQKSVREDLANAMTTTDQNMILDIAFGDDRKELYQPAFYVLQDGEDWSTDLVRALEPLSEEATVAVGKMMLAWKNINKAQRGLDALLNKGDSRGNRPGTGEGKFGGETGGDTGGGPTGQNRKDRQKAAEEKRIMNKEKELEEAENRFFALKDEVRELVPTYDLYPDEVAKRAEEKKRAEQQKRQGNNPGQGMYEGGGEGGYEGGGPGLGGEGGSFMKGGGGPPGEYSRPGGRRDRRGRQTRGNPDEKKLIEDDALEVWVHDLAVQAGAVYRYRMHVDYHNPFFGKGNRLSDDQKDLSKLTYTSSAPTEWSDPMRVVATKQFYVTKGTYEPSIEDRRAAIEVYVYTGGSERMLALSIRPGEPIGEIRQELAKLDSESADPDEIDSDDRGSADDETAVDDKIDINYVTGAVLLDVIELEAAETSRDRKVQVLVALADGTIVVLDPDEQKNSEDRRWLRELVAKDAK